MADRVCSASSFRRWAMAAATPMTPPVAVVWKRYVKVSREDISMGI